MWMSEFDICQRYRQAKDKRNIVHVLADLNAEPVENIVKILEQGGEYEKQKPKRHGTQKYHANTLPPNLAEVMEKFDRREINRLEAAQMCGMTPNGWDYWRKKWRDMRLGIG